MKSINWLPQQLLDPLIEVSSGIRIWLVGGAIRNKLLDHKSVDFDFAVEKDGRRIARKVADRLGGVYYELDRERDTGRVILMHEKKDRLLLDFASLRGRSIEEDLIDRDFTVNALAVELSALEEILDPTGGLQDLKDKLLRICSSDSIVQDPVRGLRAVRIAIEHDFVLEPNSLEAIRAGRELLPEVSHERIRDEIFRLFDLPLPGKALRLMDTLGYVSVLFPQLDPLSRLEQSPPHEFQVWEHTLAVIDQLGKLLAVLSREYRPEAASELIFGEINYRLGRFREEINNYLELELSYGRSIRQLLFFGTLFHDAGKQACYELHEGRIQFLGHEKVGAEILTKVASGLRLSNVEIKWLELLIQNHLRPGLLEREEKISQRAIYRFLRHSDQAGIAIVLLSIADMLGKQTPPMDQEALAKRVGIARWLLTAILEAPSKQYHPDPILRGDEIAEILGIDPGPMIGRLLNALQEAQVSGDVKTKSDAYAYIRKTHSGMNHSEIESKEG
jgi:tRNA nucleotidyltransferase/poly(A) polymerase